MVLLDTSVVIDPPVDLARMSSRSPRPRLFDLLVASVAADLCIPLLTRNPADFADIHEVVRVLAV